MFKKKENCQKKVGGKECGDTKGVGMDGGGGGHQQQRLFQHEYFCQRRGRIRIRRCMPITGFT